MKDLSSLLEEVQAIVKELRDEKNFLQDKLKKVEEELGAVKQEKSQWNKELQSTRSELERVQEDSQNKLNRVLPEIRTLQDQLQDAELQNNLLNIELTNAIQSKDEQISQLETQLKKYTSLLQANSSHWRDDSPEKSTRRHGLRPFPPFWIPFKFIEKFSPSPNFWNSRGNFPEKFSIDEQEHEIFLWKPDESFSNIVQSNFHYLFRCSEKPDTLRPVRKERIVPVLIICFQRSLYASETQIKKNLKRFIS